MKQKYNNWQKFHYDRLKSEYPEWPNELMLRLIFGNFLKDRIKIKKKIKVLDVGCGFGNNLLAFSKFNAGLYGTEVTKDICELTSKILKDKNIDSTIKLGFNKKIPFKNNFFDLLLSINVIHYENNEADINKALIEYRRVLKKGGSLILITVGPEHQILNNAKIIKPHVYKINKYDFRNGEKFFYFDSEKYLNAYLSKYFREVETGRSTEKLMTKKLDFLVSKAMK